jgi:hypothetical protein
MGGRNFLAGIVWRPKNLILAVTSLTFNDRKWRQKCLVRHSTSRLWNRTLTYPDENCRRGRLGRGKTIPTSSKNFAAKVYTTFWKFLIIKWASKISSAANKNKVGSHVAMSEENYHLQLFRIDECNLWKWQVTIVNIKMTSSTQSLFHTLYQSNFKSARNSVLAILRTLAAINLETPAQSSLLDISNIW